jgi:hypothetical protein
MRKKMTTTAENNAGVQRLCQLICISCFVTIHFSVFAQSADSLSDKRCLRRYATVFSAGYAASIVGMHYLWYKDSERQSFQFFNDNAEWKQVDKLGHFYSSFYVSSLSASVLSSCNLQQRRADLVGAATGFLVLLPVEVFDGFSKDYGASSGDLIANAGGSLFFLGQKFIWNEIRLIPKFSFRFTKYPPVRPTLLGDDPVKEIFKDYNGQTYWLSVDVDKFFEKMPKWLNVAVGYGAEDMAYARDWQNIENSYFPYRQYYLGIDFDLTSIRTRSKVVKTLLAVSRAIKLPGPAIEISRNKAHFHFFRF